MHTNVQCQNSVLYAFSKYFQVFISLLLVLAACLSSSQAKLQTTREDILQIASAVLRMEKRSYAMLDTACSPAVFECYPGFAKFLVLDSFETRCFNEQLRSAGNYSWRGKLAGERFIKSSDRSWPRFWICLSKPIFIRANKAVIYKETPGGDTWLLFSKSGAKWRFQAVLCEGYY